MDNNFDTNNQDINNQNLVSSENIQNQPNQEPPISPYNITDPTPTPTKNPLKKIIIIAIIALLAIGGTVTAIILLNQKPTPPAEEFEFDYDEFEKAESDLRDYEDSILSDPVFSITPYTDPADTYSIRAWFVNENIIIGITPNCNQTQDSSYIESAKNYLTSNLGEDLSKYTIQIQSCQE